ncbi:MAG: flagellar biosynthetic protein FliO, partial [SAR324 cluster bacterium]|nr:flagellar biosynthetic protein FliO [SAR324 cluster bacterium]
SQAEQISLQFDGTYPDEPIVNFEPGALSVRLVGTKMAEGLGAELTPPNESLIRNVLVSQPAMAEFVQVDILFNSSRMALGNPEVWREGNRMFLDLQFLNLVDLQTSALGPSTNLIDEVGERVRRADRFPSTFSKATPDPPAEVVAELDKIPVQVASEMELGSAIPDQDWSSTLIGLLIALFLILALIYGLAWVYGKFLSGKFPMLENQVNTRQVSVFHLGPKQKVVVLEIRKQLFACGVTPQSISLLAKLDNERDQTYLNALDLDGGQVNIDNARLDFLKTLEKARQRANSNELEQVIPDTGKKFAQDWGTKTETTKTKEIPETEARVAEWTNPRVVRSNVYAPIDAGYPVRTVDLEGSTMEGFAGKLTSRLKTLKPIR